MPPSMVRLSSVAFVLCGFVSSLCVLALRFIHLGLCAAFFCSVFVCLVFYFASCAVFCFVFFSVLCCLSQFSLVLFFSVFPSVVSSFAYVFLLDLLCFVLSSRCRFVCVRSFVFFICPFVYQYILSTLDLPLPYLDCLCLSSVVSSFASGCCVSVSTYMYT